ncbi:hypothetical protein [Roseibium sp.]|uniref:hypothetical protein n=1 Tax=Roseibium sp. TaxID=1936156 RepID=UPI003BA93757
MHHAPPPAETVSDQDLKACLDIVAGLVADHGEEFVDLYLRLESEMTSRQLKKNVMRRILKNNQAY